MPEVKLSPRQQLFITEYSKCLNASEAARRAGYKGDASVMGARLLAKVSQFIETTPVVDAPSIMSAQEVLETLSAIARGDMGDFIDDNTLSINIRNAQSKGKMHLVKKIKYITKVEDDSQTDTVEFELYDRVKALELLGRHYALFTDRLQVDDWHTQAIEDIKRGLIDYRSLAEAFDEYTATALFAAAGSTLPSE